MLVLIPRISLFLFWLFLFWLFLLMQETASVGHMRKAMMVAIKQSIAMDEGEARPVPRVQMRYEMDEMDEMEYTLFFTRFLTVFTLFHCVHSFQLCSLFSTLFTLFTLFNCVSLFSTLFHSFSTVFHSFSLSSLFVIRFNTPLSLAVVLFSRYGVDVPDDGPITTIFDVRGSGSTLRNPSSFLITTSSLRPLIQNLRSVALESARLNQTNVADPMRYGDTLHLHESSVLEQCT